MPGCRKNRSVLVAESHDEFIALLDRALGLTAAPEYLQLLQQEALANTWEAKADVIAELIRANL